MRLYVKPKRFSPAHKNPNLAELVCSNSLRSAAIDSAVGLLKEKMRLAGSLIMDVAHKTQVPAGKAMAVDSVRKRISAPTGQRFVRKACAKLLEKVCYPKIFSMLAGLGFAWVAKIIIKRKA